MLDGFIDNLLNPLVGDGRLVTETVVSASVLLLALALLLSKRWPCRYSRRTLVTQTHLDGLEESLGVGGRSSGGHCCLVAIV